MTNVECSHLLQGWKICHDFELFHAHFYSISLTSYAECSVVLNFWIPESAQEQFDPYYLSFANSRQSHDN